MTDPVALARVSADGLVLEFPRGFRFFGWLVTAIGVAAWGWLGVQLRSSGLSGLRISELLVLQVFSLPFGIGLLIWSSQKIALIQGRIVSRHLGRQRQLELATTRLHKTVASGIYLRDASGKKLFVSQWLVGFADLTERLAREPAEGVASSGERSRSPSERGS